MNLKTNNKKKTTIIICVLCVVFACLAIVAVLYIKKANQQSDGFYTEDKKCTIYFIRHGKTQTNRDLIFAGCKTDAQLVDEGKAATKKTGEALANIQFNSAFSSELSRTKDTINIVLQENHNKIPKVIPLKDLNDSDLGELEGMHVDDVKIRYPDYSEEKYLGSITDSSFKSPINATSKYEMVNNFKNALKYICDNTPDGGNALVVGHSSFIWLLEALFPDQMKGVEKIDNSSVTILEYDHGKWSLKRLNMNADMI